MQELTCNCKRKHFDEDKHASKITFAKQKRRESMRQTEEKQFNHERKKLNKKGLLILLVALVAVIALAVVLLKKERKCK